MSYYKGDFYQGDFYRGDPGFFSFLGKIAKGAAGIASSFIPGVGGAVGKILDRPIVKAGIGAITKHPVLSAAGAAGVIGAGGTMIERRSGRMGAGVGPQAGIRRGRVMGMGKRHRRMHVTNVRALRRAIRRAKGFERLARKVMHFTSPRPPRGRAVFKMRRKKRI